MGDLNYNPEQLSLARHRQRLATKQVALMLDLSVTAYESIESGNGQLSDAQLQKLALLFRIDVSDLQNKPAVKKKKKLNKRAREKRESEQSQTDPEYISEEELAEAREKDPNATPESLRFLKFIASMIVENTMQDLEQENLLKASPGGFHPERTLPCAICNAYVSGEKAWFDTNGQTCLHCHQAITANIIPAELAQDPGSFYREVELDIYFMLQGKMLNQLIREKLLKVRVIKHQDGKGTHQRIFLHGDNPGFFPPKDILKGGVVKEMNADGQEEFVFPPWYVFNDPNEHLKDYGIAKVMRWDRYNPRE